MRPKIYFRHLLTILLLSVVLPLHADWSPLVSHFSPDIYEAGTQNWTFCQQPNGWLYVANNYGLLEFDGSRWRLYGLPGGSVVRSLASDNNGSIYAGGTDDFGVFTPSHQGRMVYRSLTDSVPEENRHFGEVWSLHWCDSVLYVQSRNYVFVVQESGHVDVVQSEASIYTTQLLDKHLYVATSRDFCVLDDELQLRPVQGAELLRGKLVSAMVADTSHLYVATEFHGVYVYDGVALRRFQTQADNLLMGDQLYSMALGNGKIAFGTVRNGLILTDRQGHRLMHMNRDYGMQNNTVLSLFFDRQGSLWAGLDRGIDCVRLGLNISYLFDPAVDAVTGYGSCVHNGVLYLATNQGLYMYQGDRMRLVSGSLGQTWNIQSIDGHLLCCHNRGLFELRGGQLTPLYQADGAWRVQQLNDTTAIVGTYSGFCRLNMRPSGINVQKLAGFAETSLYFSVDGNGRIWMLTSRGMERLSLQADGLTLERKLVRAVPQAQLYWSIARVGDNVMLSNDTECLMTTGDGELVAFDPTTIGLPAVQRYLYVERDKNGNWWYLSENGYLYFCCRTEDGHAKPHLLLTDSYGLVGGFANLHVQGQTAYVGGVDGFRKVDLPVLLVEPQGEPQLFIRRVRTLTPNHEVVYGEVLSQETCPSLTLASGVHSLRIEYACSDEAIQPVLYSTRLRPIEREFSEPTLQPYRDFTAISSGRYTLEIRAITADGKELTRVLPFRIRRPWYASILAIIIYLILTVLAVVLGVRAFINHLQEESRAKQREQEEQLRQQQVAILQLEADKAQFELRQKSQELSSLLLTEVNRKELTNDMLTALRRVADLLQNGKMDEVQKQVQSLQKRLTNAGESTIDWKRFEDNFDIVNDNFVSSLQKLYPWMTKLERRLCVYIRMGLATKEIAPLLNMSVRSVEMMRYRMRQKMQLDSDTNLRQYFEHLT